MERCPLCRATLNGADTCRRCRAELGSAQRVEGEARALLGEAMLCLARADRDDAAELLRRAVALHAAPEIVALWRAVSVGDLGAGSGA